MTPERVQSEICEGTSILIYCKMGLFSGFITADAARFNSHSNIALYNSHTRPLLKSHWQSALHPNVLIPNNGCLG